MTPLQALLQARAVGARLSVNQARGTLIVETEAAGDISPELLTALKEHRDWLLEHLLQPSSPSPRRLDWQAFDHVCHTGCEREHSR